MNVTEFDKDGVYQKTSIYCLPLVVWQKVLPQGNDSTDLLVVKYLASLFFGCEQWLQQQRQLL